MALPVDSSSDAADRVQVELLRAAGMKGRLARTRALTSAAIRMARRAIQDQHPEMTQEEVLLEFVAVHYGRELAEKVRRHLLRRKQ